MLLRGETVFVMINTHCAAFMAHSLLIRSVGSEGNRFNQGQSKLAYKQSFGLYQAGAL